MTSNDLNLKCDTVQYLSCINGENMNINVKYLQDITFSNVQNLNITFNTLTYSFILFPESQTAAGRNEIMNCNNINILGNGKIELITFGTLSRVNTNIEYTCLSTSYSGYSTTTSFITTTIKNKYLNVLTSVSNNRLLSTTFNNNTNINITCDVIDGMTVMNFTNKL